MHYTPMSILAETDLASLGTLLGIVFAAFAALMAGFYAFANRQMKDSREERRDERIEFSKALQDMANASREVATATVQGNKEAQERNGHLAELVAKTNGETITAINVIPKTMKDIADSQAKAIVIALKSSQNVHEQNVEHQHVQSTDVG